METYPDYYPDEKDVDILWAFKKYFWESSPKLPLIDIDKLSLFIQN
jgi:hypothetical protein